MKKYFVLYNIEPCGGIVYSTYFRDTKPQNLNWIIAFNKAEKRTWDYFWFSKFADNAFNDLLSAQKHLLTNIFKH